MILVFDASVAVKWFIAEPDSPAARTALASASRALAPELILAEVLNAGWSALRRSQITGAQFAGMSRSIEQFFDDLASLGRLAPRAATIARQLDHPVYDCFYLALAEREAVELVTADRRLLGRVHASPWAASVRALDSFATPYTNPAIF